MTTYLFQRIVHNEHAWASPSPGRQSAKIDRGFLNSTGFAGDDWNFAFADAVKGNLHGYSRYHPAKPQGDYNIVFAVYETGGRWSVAGFYEDAIFAESGRMLPDEIIERRAQSLHVIRRHLSDPYRTYTLPQFRSYVRNASKSSRIVVPVGQAVLLPAPLEVTFDGIERMGKHFGTATRISVEQYAAIKQSCSAVYGRRSTQNESFPEGKLFETRHKRRERSKALINRTKSIFKRENDGRLFCEVCGFDFGAFYGELGHNFIEVHHTIPVHTLRDRDKSRVEDMAVVCSNCHRMLDRRRPWLRKAQIKNILA